MWMLFGQNHSVYAASGLTKAHESSPHQGHCIYCKTMLVGRFLSPVSDKNFTLPHGSGGRGLRGNGNRFPLDWTSYFICTMHLVYLQSLVEINDLILVLTSIFTPFVSKHFHEWAEFMIQYETDHLLTWVLDIRSVLKALEWLKCPFS